MIDPLPIHPIAVTPRGAIRPPGSKSLTNRALIVAALTDGESHLTGVLDSEDTQVMIESLRRIGLRVSHDLENATVTVFGCGGKLPNHSADLWIENSGTSVRFLTALCVLGQGRYRLDGNSRMRERPIGDLVKTLQSLGTDVRCEQNTHCPPVVLQANGLKGGVAEIAGNISSQFLSALLMVAPAANDPVELWVRGKLVSKPYIDMTLSVMESFGVTVKNMGYDSFQIEPQSYQAASYAIEPDASAASYFFAAAAITGGRMTVLGLSRDALQGDIGFVDALEQMGCDVKWEQDRVTVAGRPLCGIDIDMNAISDTAQTLATVAVFAEGETRIRNVEHMRHKETDRVEAVANELRKLGQQVEVLDDGLTIHPAPVTPAVIETYNDHRMAMSFALIGLKAEGIQIANPRCTEKTYPRFFEDLNQLCPGTMQA